MPTLDRNASFAPLHLVPATAPLVRGAGLPTVEEMLAEAARAAGEPTVAELVVEHGDLILRWARRMAPGEAAAEDLAQEAVLRALRSAHTFRPGTHFRGWMKTIVRNLAINQGRRQAKGPQTAGSEAVERAIDEAPAREEVLSLESSEDLLRHRDALGGPLARALDGLTEIYRRVLLLSAVEGLAYKEIAQRLQIPIGTVMSRLHRARREMKNALLAHPEEVPYVMRKG
jgi:RNA polymerase sigma-70 factor (ECF subfamily)